MECACGKPAVFERKFEGRSLCKTHFIRTFENKVRRTINRNKMVQTGDKIAVGLSGGKDSSTLLYLLNKLCKDRKDVELFAITVDEGIEGYRKDSIEIAKGLCKSLGIKHRITSYKEHFGKTLDQKLKTSKDFNACTYCGVARRWSLNKMAKDLGATKLAVGHNLDDETQSILMDYLKGDLTRLIRLDPQLKPKDEFVRRIKPLRGVAEKEVGLFAFLKGLKIQEDECPYSSGMRFEIRDFLNKMENERPGTKLNILETFEKILPALKETIKTEEGQIFSCEKCGEPSSSKICKTCEFWA